MQEGFHPAFMGAPLPAPGKEYVRRTVRINSRKARYIFVSRAKYTRTIVVTANRQMSAVSKDRHDASFACGLLVHSLDVSNTRDRRKRAVGCSARLVSTYLQSPAALYIICKMTTSVVHWIGPAGLCRILGQSSQSALMVLCFRTLPLIRTSNLRLRSFCNPSNSPVSWYPRSAGPVR